MEDQKRSNKKILFGFEMKPLKITNWKSLLTILMKKLKFGKKYRRFNNFVKTGLNMKDLKNRNVSYKFKIYLNDRLHYCL